MIFIKPVKYSKFPIVQVVSQSIAFDRNIFKYQAKLVSLKSSALNLALEQSWIFMSCSENKTVFEVYALLLLFMEYVGKIAVNFPFCCSFQFSSPHI